MDVIETFNQLNLQSELVAVAIVIVALLLVLHLNRHRLQLRFREWRIQRCLNRIGVEQIRNLACADGLEGEYNIERLVLTPEAILLITYKPFVGNIYCAERISEWTQVIGQKSFKFTNPLFEIDNQITALQLAIGKVPLRGYLFFSHSAVFPKGHPESVMQPNSIPAAFQRGHEQPIKQDILEAWEQLKWLQTNNTGAAEIRVKT